MHAPPCSPADVPPPIQLFSNLTSRAGRGTAGAECTVVNSHTHSHLLAFDRARGRGKRGRRGVLCEEDDRRYEQQQQRPARGKPAAQQQRDQDARPQGRGGGGSVQAKLAAAGGGVEGSAVDAGQLLAAAARFCQGAAELQYVGVWRASKRRRAAAVQRTFEPLDVEGHE